MFNLLLDERLVQVVWWWCHILLLRLIWIEIICTCTSIVRWWSYRVWRSRFRWLEPFHWMVQPNDNKWTAVIHNRMVPHNVIPTWLTIHLLQQYKQYLISLVPTINPWLVEKLSQLISTFNYYYNRHRMSCTGLQITVDISKLNITYIVTVPSSSYRKPITILLPAYFLIGVVFDCTFCAYFCWL